MAVMRAPAHAEEWLVEAKAADFIWAGFDITLTTSLAQAEWAWRSLEACGTASLFQSHAFVEAWLSTAAAASREAPLFVVATLGGAARFVLPLAKTQRLGARLLTWLGQSHANYGMGLLHPDVLAVAASGALNFDTLLGEIAKRANVDLVHLDHQPSRWAGQANPFTASQQARQTANDTFVLALDDDFQRQYKTLFSSRTLSGLKRKQRKLEDMGTVVFDRPWADEPRTDALDWFFAQKTAQLNQAGKASPYAETHIQALYLAMAHGNTRFDIDLLTVDGVNVAMGLTARDGKTAYLLNSVHQGAEYARCSPGALLLHRQVTQAHAAGARAYDFGPGELPYKLEWEPDVVPLVATTTLIKTRGLVAWAAIVLGVVAKAKIKRDPQLYGWVGRIRAAKAKLLGRG